MLMWLLLLLLPYRSKKNYLYAYLLQNMGGAVSNLLHTENRQAWHGMDKVINQNNIFDCNIVFMLSKHALSHNATCMWHSCRILRGDCEINLGSLTEP